MTLRIYAGVQSSRVDNLDSAGGATSGLTLNFTDNSGTFTTADIGNFCHVDITSVSSGYDDLATLIKNALEAVSARTYTVTFSTTNLTYTIAPDAGTFRINVAGSTEALTNALGFYTIPTNASASLTSYINYDFGGGAADYTATVYYAIAGTVGGRRNVSDEYEPDGIAYDAEADDGSSYGISRSASPTYHDFTVPLEAKEKTYIRSASVLSPWTHEHMIKHVRNVEPFLIVDSNTSESTVMKLRADGSSFKPEREVADYDGAWNIPYKCRVLGSL